MWDGVEVLVEGLWEGGGRDAAVDQVLTKVRDSTLRGEKRRV